MRKMIKIAFVVGLALLCMCIYIGDISNKMEGGYDRQYNIYVNVSMGILFSIWNVISTYDVDTTNKGDK